MIKYSIIIPLYNQLDELHWHIKFYNALWAQRQDFEVLYMDDGSSDNSGNFIRQSKDIMLFPFQYEWEEDKGFTVSYAKNRGIRKATGEWLLILDGDTFIDPETLSAYDRVLKDKDTVYFGKRYPVRMRDLDQALHDGFPTIVERKEDFRGFLQPIPPAPFYHFSGANFVVHKDIANDLKYAPDDWNQYGYDDYYMAINYLVHGKKFEPVNDSVAYHCEDDPKPGHPVTKERLNAFIKEHEAELQQLSGVRYF